MTTIPASGGGPAPGLGRRVLVPVANPASAGPFLELAARIARADGGRVELVSVLPPGASDDERRATLAALADGEAVAAGLGVAVRARAIADEDVARAVLADVERLDASLVLMGWRGTSSTSDVFGRLIDRIVGRSHVPLAIARLGVGRHRRVVLPVSADHLLPGGSGGLCLAARLADRLRADTMEPTTLLRTGPRGEQLPAEVAALGDRIHHDPRRTDRAVAAFARADDLVVAAVAPTVSGLRAATTHLAWAAPESTLLVAIDVGPRAETGLDRAVGSVTVRPERLEASPEEQRAVRVIVTARLPEDGRVTLDALERVLRPIGTVEQPMTWWPVDDARAHVRATVSVHARTIDAAIGRVMAAVRDSDALAGAEISYDLEGGAREQWLRSDQLSVRRDEVTVTARPMRPEAPATEPTEAPR